MQWNMRMRAAQVGIWKSTEMRRRLAEAGLDISAGKMSALWISTPITVRLEDLDVICAVLDCTPSELLICEAGKAAARRPIAATATGTDSGHTRRSGRRTSRPSASSARRAGVPAASVAQAPTR